MKRLSKLFFVVAGGLALLALPSPAAAGDRGGGAGAGGGGRGGDGGQRGAQDAKGTTWTVTFLAAEKGMARVQDTAGNKAIYFIKGSEKLTEATGLKTLQQAQGTPLPTGEWVISGALVETEPKGIVADSIKQKEANPGGRGGDAGAGGGRGGR